jgi:glycosyltransferase involved in cell wall biosynthesis
VANSLVSVGLATYNGEPCVRETLDSLLAQTHDDLELVVSDDASSDATYSICREYAARDERIRLYANPENLGGYGNFNRTLALARGDYFMWAAQDDRWDPRMLETCLALLRSDPRVVLAYPRGLLVDAAGKPIDHVTDEIDTRALDPVDVPAYVLANLRSYHVFFGLSRASALRRLRGLRDVYSACVPTVVGLALQGSLAQVPETMFYKRTRADDAGMGESWKRRMLGALSFARRLERYDRPMSELVREVRDVTVQVILESDLPRSQSLLAAAKALAVFETTWGVPLPLYRLREVVPARSYLALAQACAARYVRPPVAAA